ncbi:XRE family transcriptional regulator (plasmid) [Amycolatopsis sp. AA4]|uniref:DUF2690 domain-containing protein n=1 Tax=Actinomycetes TaxID=1760 RepID=UPI0001B56184|nr:MULTISPECIES: DUF2690 domain-containing protein [Actinomycetes]ATY16971.1 XRE family transcriptional regulator [Amycolatopsis sp. AA4]EFL12542.1 hypothetical protein SSMG_08213 [Streptomyces sp. AA4]
MRGRWRPLPESLAPEAAYLAGVLREFKDRSGLSLATLGDRTNFSKSSWERWLNGKALPPAQAVSALAQLAGEETGRPLALWERAQARWSGRDAAPRAATAAAREQAARQRQPASRGRRRDRRIWALAATAACAAGAAALAALPQGVLGTSAVPPASTAYTVGCRGSQCTGQDAHPTACDVDAATYADLRVGRAYLELRISDQCGAAWARVSASAVGDRIEVADTDGRSERAAVGDAASAGQYVPTLMIAADRHSQVRACLEHGGQLRCTPWGTSTSPTASSSGRSGPGSAAVRSSTPA